METAENLFKKQFSSPPDSHNIVLKYCKNMLISLKNNRHYCDYELNNEFYSYLPNRYKFSLDDLIDFSDYIIRTLK